MGQLFHIFLDLHHEITSIFQGIGVVWVKLTVFSLRQVPVKAAHVARGSMTSCLVRPAGLHQPLLLKQDVNRPCFSPALIPVPLLGVASWGAARHLCGQFEVKIVQFPYYLFFLKPYRRLSGNFICRNTPEGKKTSLKAEHSFPILRTTLSKLHFNLKGKY